MESDSEKEEPHLILDGIRRDKTMARKTAGLKCQQDSPAEIACCLLCKMIVPGTAGGQGPPSTHREVVVLCLCATRCERATGKKVKRAPTK
ncbi:hypothetical protein OUZ56_010806 [Daphnia magna]|uniref:Uncharacterized protein n=1 Tax=Daphnia magna TaxID=35525 RepID=A0ABQ9YYK8_9CRUS|nr:hypothetical protein OUZ56_010806 [Daphnia magna]